MAITPNKLLEKTAAVLELPPEVALDTVKLSLTGHGELRAVNHRGILIYERERIVFRCSQGLLTVQGRELNLAELNDERLRILGRIRLVRLPGGEGEPDLGEERP